MKFLLSFVFVAFLLSFVSADDVIVLDSSNFDEFISNNELTLVEFYAPWCGHCKRLAPEYEKAATALKELGIPIANFNADEEQNRPIASAHGIKGFPTLKVFRNGKSTPYEGERSAEAIIRFMKKQNLPAISALETSADVSKFSKEDKIVIVGFFENRDSAGYEGFKSNAEQLRDDFVFGEVIGKPDIAQEFGVKQGGVVLFKDFDEGKNVLESLSNEEELTTFIRANSVPLIDEIGPSNFRKYAEAKLPLAYLFVDPNVEGQKSTYVNMVSETAKETKGKINWVFIDHSKYGRHGESLGLSGQTVPAISVDDMEAGKHYAFDETAEITAEAVNQWIKKFLNGELEPTVKSEEIPESNDGPVTVVVAKTFDQIVMDSEKDVLVEFYAPWCGHCKKLAPIYDQLGESFKGTSVVIAKIDATANDVDSKLGIRGFPTIKLFPAKDKKPIDYEGDRSLEDLKSFVSKHATLETSKPEKDEL